MTSESPRRPRPAGAQHVFVLAAVLVCLAVSLGSLSQARAADPPADNAAPAAPAPSAAAAAAAAVTDFPAAIKKLEDAYRDSPSSETLYQLGLLADARGKVVEAQDFMRRYLADPVIDANAPGRVDAERVLSQPRPPSGEVQILADQNGLVLLDGRLMGTLPLALPLLVGVGKHEVWVEMRDKTIKGKVKVIDGRGFELSFSRASGAVVVTRPPAVIVLPQYAGAPVPPELQRRFQQAVEQAISKARLAVFSREVALSRSPKLADCVSKLTCQAQLATENEVDYSLVLRVDHQVQAGAGKETWAVDLTLVDAEVADVAASAQPSCGDCTSDALAAALPDAVRKMLREGQSKQRGSVTITSEPPGAEVRDGQRLLGQTPLTRAMFTGTYDLTIKKSDFGVERTQVEIKDGKKATVAVTLVAEEPTPAPLVAQPTAPTRRPLWRYIVGGVAIAAGIVGIGFGAAALAVNDSCLAPPTAPATVCFSRYRTTSVGGGLLGAGLVLAAGGAVLIALPPSIGATERKSLSLADSPRQSPPSGLALDF